MTLLVIAVLCVILGTVCVVAGLSKGTQEEQETAEQKTDKALASLSGFNPTIVYYPVGANYGIAMDSDSDKFAIIIPGHQPRLYHFSQLVAVEVERDSETITTTNGKVSMKGAAVATALLGPIGLLAGAKTSSKSKSITNIKSLDLKIYVNDLQSPCFAVNFTPAGWADEESIRNVDAWYGRFKTITAGLERNGAPMNSELAIRHSAPAPAPVLPAWSKRVFGP